jgi:DNA-3-methyladenine glycosylase I
MIKTAISAIQIRCQWAVTAGNELMAQYHDTEWGVPLREDQRLFEFLILEGAQAGLSWQTVLKKRENYRKAFHNFDAQRIARYGEKDVSRLLADPGIIRNRLKIAATISNAREYLRVVEETGSFSDYLWQFVDGEPVPSRFSTLKQIPATTPQSDAMSKALKKRGFRFVGSTICYAFMQAAGMVNDHTTDCFRHNEVSKLSRRK